MANITPVGECGHKQDGGDEVIQCTFLVGGGTLAGERGGGGAIAEEGEGRGYCKHGLLHVPMTVLGVMHVRHEGSAALHCRSAVHPGLHCGPEGVHVLSSGASRGRTGRIRL